jgi:hypothetical protein
MPPINGPARGEDSVKVFVSTLPLHKPVGFLLLKFPNYHETYVLPIYSLFYVLFF